MAAEPSIGRAVQVEGAPAPEADLTRALYEEYGNQIFRYCMHQLGSREEAEDAVQSTFLNAFRGIKRGVVPELESAWLFKIAHNVCLSRRRTTWRRGRIESPTDFDVVQELTPAPSRRADELIGLQDVLEQMPDNQRRAILLREWQGLSYREIAEELEVTQAAVETLIFRARRSLAAGLEQPPEAKKRKLARGADLGNILAGVKSLLIGGSAAAKVAATVAVVSASTVVAAAPVEQHMRSHHPSLPAAQAPVAKTPAKTPAAAVSVAGPAASFPTRAATHAAKAAHRPSRPQLSARLDAGTAGAALSADPALPAAEPAPAAAAPAPPQAAEPQPSQPQLSEPPHAAAVTAPPAPEKVWTSDKLKGSEARGTPPPAVLLPVQAAAPSPRNSESKGGNSKHWGDSKKLDNPVVRLRPVTLSVQPPSTEVTTPTPVVAQPTVTVTAPAPVGAPTEGVGSAQVNGDGKKRASAAVWAPPVTLTRPAPVAPTSPPAVVSPAVIPSTSAVQPPATTSAVWSSKDK